MSALDRLSSCGHQVRRHDHDRYLTSLFAPADRREALFAIAAFNLEVAKTREVVSEPMLGRIRLQWWRESIDGIYDGRVRRHEVVEPLAHAVDHYDLTRGHFDRVIDARDFDLEDRAPVDLAELESYAEATAAPLMWLALAGIMSDQQVVVVDGEEKKRYYGVGTLIFNPNSEHVAYAGMTSDKQFAIINEEEGKQYDTVLKGTLVFSPDSKHVAYAAAIGKDMFVVVDGKEGDYYNNIITLGGGRVAFDSPDSLHYLALRAKDIYLVEEMV